MTASHLNSQLDELQTNSLYEGILAMYETEFAGSNMIVYIFNYIRSSIVYNVRKQIVSYSVYFSDPLILTAFK